MRSGIPPPERADPELLSIGFECHGTIPVGAIDVRPNPFEPFKDILMGNVKDVVCSATDNGHLRSHFFKKGGGTGTKTAVVRHKEHIAVKTAGGFGQA